MTELNRSFAGTSQSAVSRSPSRCMIAASVPTRVATAVMKTVQPSADPRVATSAAAPQNTVCVTMVANHGSGWQTRYVRAQRRRCRHTSAIVTESSTVSTT